MTVVVAESHKRGDEAELFERYHRRLVNATARRVNTSRDNIEEAAAFAWAALLSHEVRRDTVFGWLKEVARREAIRLDGIERGNVSLDASPAPEQLAPATGNPAVTPDRWNEAMARLRRLPERERRMVALHAFGWRYDDIAEELGVSYTLVNRLLTRAHHQFAELADRDEIPRTGRGAHLRSLEEEPPPHLKAAIGRIPKHDHRDGRSAARRLEWRRLALAIEDHRVEFAIEDPFRALGSRARSRDERVARDTLRERIDAFAELGRELPGRSR